jgi:peptidoglycan/xylan/chitin deacetylase (PgdA/CDA1 family)
MIVKYKKLRFLLIACGGFNNLLNLIMMCLLKVVRLYHITALLCLLCFFSGHISAQPRTDTLLVNLLKRQGLPALQHILAYPDSFRCQLIYTRIDRDKDNVPHFTHYYLGVDKEEYFNPASMVKLPVALLALEKLRQLQRPGVDMHTAMLTDSSYSGQVTVLTDSTAESGLPSIAQYVKRIFLISDNDAYNRLYEFVGQQTIHEKLWEKGYPDMRIVRRFMPLDEAENRHTNEIRFVKDGKTIYNQPPAVSKLNYDFSKTIKIGNGYWDRNDKLVMGPMDFTKHNNAPLENLQHIMQSVLFPASVPVYQRFKLLPEDYRLLYRSMSEYPGESRYPKYDTSEYFDSYTKFFLFKAGRGKVPPYMRVFNKTGWSYGFLTDVAYIVDFKHQVEFMISGTIYVNRDGVLNDDKYEYETEGYPFFKEVGEIIYAAELARKRKYPPNLDAFKLTYPEPVLTYSHGGIIRGDTTRRELALVFTADEFADGAQDILSALRKHHAKGSFFLTGNFYRNPAFAKIVQQLKADKHYLGPHSDQHLLYCDWTLRSRLLVTKKQFNNDLSACYAAMEKCGITSAGENRYFLPPYEWYNDTISAWSKERGIQLVNFTPGTRSNADYTYPQLGQQYRSSEEIWQSITDYEQKQPRGLNGFLLLTHLGTDSRRKDKFYAQLDKLLTYLEQRGYKFVSIDELTQ